MSKWIVYVVAGAVALIAGCTSGSGVQPTEPAASATPPATDTAVPSPVPPTVTHRLTQTATPEPSPTAAPTLTPEPTLPAVPSGMSVERLRPGQYAVRVVAPGTYIRHEPSAQTEAVATFDCGAAPLALDAVASGDASGLKWYHVADSGWVREDVVKTYTDAKEAEAAAKAANCAGTGSGTDYTPTQKSVWNFVQGEDNMSGTCSTGPILPPYGLVQIAPGDDNLMWRSQEPAPYTFSRVKTNVYSYAGPTAIGDGNVTMTLTFTGDTTLQMSRTFVPNSDPGCQHTHYYTGTFQWAVP